MGLLCLWRCLQTLEEPFSRALLIGAVSLSLLVQSLRKFLAVNVVYHPEDSNPLTENRQILESSLGSCGLDIH